MILSQNAGVVRPAIDGAGIELPAADVLARMTLVMARRCARGADAEDLAQDAVIVFLTKGSMVRDPARLGAWLRTVVRRLAAHRRRQALGRTLAESGYVELVVASNKVVPNLKDLLQGATPRTGRLLGWVSEGYSQVEIAQRLGCSVKTVGHKVCRAIAQVRKRNGSAARPTTKAHRGVATHFGSP